MLKLKKRYPQFSQSIKGDLCGLFGVHKNLTLRGSRLLVNVGIQKEIQRLQKKRAESFERP